jgi:pimeloyl-ACP methyl ester carboxylesterase
MTTKFKSGEGEAHVTKWHESLVGVDLLLLYASPVFYGIDVPRGDGSAVIMLPGFMHSDVYLVVMYSWLSRIGYRPYYSGIDLNAECPDLLIKYHLNELLDDAMKETGGKVHLIGHSLGGVIARSLATQRPKLVASVTTLGSPFRGALLHRSILRDTEVVRRYIQQTHGVEVPRECYTQRCKCDFMESLRRGVSASMPQTSIYTRDDGVLDWRSCRTGKSGVDVEVHGTHAGLAFNPEVYATIANRLAGLP